MAQVGNELGEALQRIAELEADNDLLQAQLNAANVMLAHVERTEEAWEQRVEEVREGAARAHMAANAAESRAEQAEADVVELIGQVEDLRGELGQALSVQEYYRRVALNLPPLREVS